MDDSLVALVLGFLAGFIMGVVSGYVAGKVSTKGFTAKYDEEGNLISIVPLG